MYSRVVLYPYRTFSESARHLRTYFRDNRIGPRRAKIVRQNGNYHPFRNHLIINWGNTSVPNWWGPRPVTRTLNLPQYVENASAKDKTFEILSANHLPVPMWTRDINVARGWLANPIYGRRLNGVVCRTLTRGNSGRGIVLAKEVQEVVPAPLYTRYMPKQDEYRVHVFSEKGVIDVQQKRKVNGFDENEEANKYIRNHPNGWVFCREDVELPAPVREAALSAVLALHLDFGAVDIGYHEKFGPAIYEVNTAPGLEGQTLINYGQTIATYLR